MQKGDLTLRTELLARRVKYILLCIIIVAFGAFFLIGYDRPYVDNPLFNEPMLTNVVLILLFVFIVLALCMVVWSLTQSVNRKKRAEGYQDKLSRKMAWTVAGTTAAVLLITFLLGSTKAITVNGADYNHPFWLRVADMFVYTSLLLLVVAVCAMAYSFWRSRQQEKS